MQDGMQINQGTLIEVLQGKVAQSAIRESQMEAGIQQLLLENQRLKAEVEFLGPKDDTEDPQAYDLGPDIEAPTLEPSHG